jgi:uncharacterized SAM-binding protein YcdF (DUF218 family)
MTIRRGRFRLVQNSERGGIFFRLILLSCFLGFLFVVYLLRHPLLHVAGGFWILNDPPLPSDVIVVLGDDNYNGDRAARAAELFKAGWAPRVIASGRDLRPYATIPELEEHDLESRGVPKTAIIRSGNRGDSIRDEAAALADLLSQRGWRRVLLVTSSYQTRRARYIAARSFPRGTVLRVEAARDYEYDPDSWWTTRRGVKIFFHEVVGMSVTLWEMRHNGVQTADSSLENPSRPGVGSLYHADKLPVYDHFPLYYIFSTHRTPILWSGVPPS